MEWIKFNGRNAFQVYGFVKDHTSKYEWWKVYFGRFTNGNTVKLYQDGENTAQREIYISRGDYIVFNSKMEYVFRIYKFRGNIFLHYISNLFMKSKRNVARTLINADLENMLRDDK